MEALKFNIETFNNEKKYNDLKVFDCSDLVINKYVKDNLKKQNVRNNVKTLVLTKNSDSVIGFVTVNLFQLSKEVVPSTIFSFSLPPKIGVMKISMLAVDKKYQKNGWGLDLMKAAFSKNVYELLKRNEFRWIQVGTKYRISKKSFDEWLDKMMENP